MLRPSDDPLTDRYDLAVLDLDGVVYVGASAVPGAAAALASARDAGMHLAFVTNNAARPPAAVAAQLADLGVAADDADVVTSAQAAVRLVAGEVPAGSTVYVIGGEGLEDALVERGFRPATSPSADVVAVVQGYGPQMPWKQAVDGAILVRAGLPWVASNTDLTIPTESGPGPGNGTLVNLVAEFADRRPLVAGKPEAALFEETLDRVGGRCPLVVGDRLDTDIEGAVRLGWDSLLVLTGVTGLTQLVAAPPELRPTYLGRDLAALHTAHPAPERAPEPGDGWSLAGWRASTLRGRLQVDGEGSVDDWWRVVADAAWQHLDETRAPVDVTGVHPPE